MSRPRWPLGIVLPVGAIQRIREEQEAYDRDPEGYDRRQREAKERREEERRQEQEAQFADDEAARQRAEERDE